MFSNKTIDASAGSIIMAFGIFLLGAVYQFPFLNSHLALALSGLLVLVWLFMLFAFFLSLSKRDYRNSLVNLPIKSFGVGTWIAASSVIDDLIIQRAPALLSIVQVLACANLVLWIAFIALCIRQWKTIIANKETKNTHGVILLSTVSTQSIVGLLVTTFGPAFHPSLMIAFIMLGILFYVFSITLIGSRFASQWRDIHEWKNTDCIIHGAISITGLALVQSGSFSLVTILFVWYIVLFLFGIVETAEIIRGIARIQKYGWQKGIFTYHITQWARNFTFGMFYFFTFNLVHTFSSSSKPLSFQNHFLHFLGWIVLILLIVELSLFLIFIVTKTNPLAIAKKI
ncbi:hypothetical protein [Psychrobacillus lasiicapitis]|uniref:Voltage-dependent anion channel n=1 Tax=Psychrobacillus lasiicapitis TaxID=1636719 RepID=A0A544T6Y7_9BACI|nr:hypothetical protein [Psychrobacillus lasiicapitis]TQR13211.1 hypothetical protein FG382_11865 [Psychrobacillus lasiicapitis]GGA33533.1 hypothetical protein GCM10011384_23990 [Psychrobacillus lasiicapitis]